MQVLYFFKQNSDQMPFSHLPSHIVIKSEQNSPFFGPLCTYEYSNNAGGS